VIFLDRWRITEPHASRRSHSSHTTHRTDVKRYLPLFIVGAAALTLLAASGESKNGFAALNG
jgi:hypothetical protein